MSPFPLTHGQDAILPIEVLVPSQKVAKQNDHTPQEYSGATNMEFESAYDKSIEAFNQMMVQKVKVAKSYDKRVCKKNFREGDLIWIVIILPIGIKDRELASGLPTGRVYSKFIKSYPAVPTGFRVY